MSTRQHYEALARDAQAIEDEFDARAAGEIADEIMRGETVRGWNLGIILDEEMQKDCMQVCADLGNKIADMSCGTLDDTSLARYEFLSHVRGIVARYIATVADLVDETQRRADGGDSDEPDRFEEAA